MKRRLYFLLPDVASAQRTVDELLLKRIPFTHMHALAKAGSDLDDLPQASVMQRNDFFRSLLIGMVAGAIAGLICGVIGHNYLSLPLGGAMLATTFFGGLIGAWAAGMIGISAPSNMLKRFDDKLEQGHILLMVDVPKEQVAELEQTMSHLHPEAHYAGLEPTIPKFP